MKHTLECLADESEGGLLVSDTRPIYQRFYGPHCLATSIALEDTS